MGNRYFHFWLSHAKNLPLAITPLGVIGKLSAHWVTARLPKRTFRPLSKKSRCDVLHGDWRRAGRHQEKNHPMRRANQPAMPKFRQPVRDAPKNIDVRIPQALSAKSNQACSSKIVSPNSSAFCRFEPAPGPATTISVLEDTEPATRAPSISARAFASARETVSNVPVNTMVLPESAPEFSASARGLGATSAATASAWRGFHRPQKTAEAHQQAWNQLRRYFQALRGFLHLPRQAPPPSWNASSVLKCRANMRAVVSPTWRIPKAKIKRSRPMLRR